MRKIIKINEAKLEGEVLHLHTEQTDFMKGIKPAGQIIADSDQYAFVYLTENEEEFVYVYLEESLWGDLQKAREENASVVLKSADLSLELDHFQEELNYLISNIEGNGNYGEEMVNKVENVFIR
ncbi:hypothetical protein LCM10_17215 [Rossellomorea aquimaris]|uniref:UPF0738 family protein n=1 Tax=Rossellomorea aquimaris TaxID=189382 RepID=UPI001CD6A7E0|nr:hypothetical protein [Rossellomorea aquimaris]MCA1056726.1 hypothetical protein [Rossellomorea aquimaris]